MLIYPKTKIVQSNRSFTVVILNYIEIYLWRIVGMSKSNSNKTIQ